MNGNPFYVPPIIPDMGNTVLNLGRLSMERDRMGEEAKYRQGMLEQGQQQIDIQERKLPASAQNFAPSDFMPMKATFAQKGYDKVVAPIFDRLDAWGQDKKVTKGVAANTLAQQWDTFFKPTVIDGLKKEYMTRAKNNPNFIGSPEETEIKGMIDSFTQMDGELAKRAFFPQVAEEEANSRAAIAAMRQERIGKDPYGDTRLRSKAKVDAFEAAMGRKATTDEKRRLFISDPYGILAPGEGEEMPPAPVTLRPPTPGERKPAAIKYSATATDAKGNKVGFDGKKWVPIK